MQDADRSLGQCCAMFPCTMRCNRSPVIAFERVERWPHYRFALTSRTHLSRIAGTMLYARLLSAGTFPPLWGPDSFNNGAGMNRLLTTTRFIRQNMPLGASHTATVLNDDEAYDVTAFMLSKPRPIKAHLEADFPARWNKPIDAAFPPHMLGTTADQHRYGPFAPLAETQRQMTEKRKADMAASKARAAADPASAAMGK